MDIPELSFDLWYVITQYVSVPDRNALKACSRVNYESCTMVGKSIKIYYSKTRDTEYISDYDYCYEDEDDPLYFSYIQCQKCYQRTCYAAIECINCDDIAYMCQKCWIMHLMCGDCYKNNNEQVLMTIDKIRHESKSCKTLNKMNMEFIITKMSESDNNYFHYENERNICFPKNRYTYCELFCCFGPDGGYTNYWSCPVCKKVSDPIDK